MKWLMVLIDLQRDLEDEVIEIDSDRLTKELAEDYDIEFVRGERFIVRYSPSATELAIFIRKDLVG